MAVPKRKTSKSVKGMRRSHDALSVGNLSSCSRCNQPKTPHRVCGNCGHYNNEKKIEVKGV
ncbi:MAG: 50S ribosomal protein L32 [Planctomycetota bacterium]|jgi:large subunit ribosomal protein L32